jgi:transcriptional regulator with XRE-family HTH domain
MTQTSLGHKLRILRAERGLTLREAASLTGVAKETISDIERGIRHPHDVTVAKLARAYDVPVEDLLTEEPVLAGNAETPDAELPEDLDDLMQMARELKAEWTRLMDYERMSRPGEYERVRPRLNEIERELGMIKARADELNPPLAWVSYQLDGPHQVEFYRRPSPQEEAELREKLGDYEVVESVFALGGVA